MNKFEEMWTCSTLAPEACIRLKSDDINNNYLNVIYNEDKSKKVFVLSNNDNIQAIGTGYSELLHSPKYTFNTGLHKIAQLLEIKSISI